MPAADAPAHPAPHRARRVRADSRAVSKTEAERKAKEAEDAAAAGGRPSHKKSAAKPDSADGTMKSPAELEVDKLEKILEVAAKTGEFNYATDSASAAKPGED